MRQVTSLHRTLVVLAVGLLALAAPLVAYADGDARWSLSEESKRRHGERPASRALSSCSDLLSSRAARVDAADVVPLSARTMRSHRGSLSRPRLPTGQTENRGQSHSRRRDHVQPVRVIGKPHGLVREFACVGQRAPLRTKLRLDRQEDQQLARVIARSIRPRYGRPVLGIVQALLSVQRLCELGRPRRKCRFDVECARSTRTDPAALSQPPRGHPLGARRLNAPLRRRRPPLPTRRAR